MNYKIEMLDHSYELVTGSNDILVCFVLSGKVKLDYHHTSKVFKKNDVFIIRPYSLLKEVNCDDAKLIVLTIDQLSFNRYSLVNIKEYNIKNENLDILIKKAFLKIIKGNYENNYLNSGIHLIKLINYINLVKYEGYGTGYANDLVLDVMDYVNNHYKEYLTVTQIAELFYVNASYLSRVFSELLNIPLSDYIRKTKMYYLASEITILNTDKDLWKKYGYKSYSTYLKNFKYLFDASPTEFIKKYKQKKVRGNKVSPDIYKIVLDHLYQLVLIEDWCAK